ncbi:MAG: glycosyltransferase family 4 protein [Actinomycetota bacterium]
MTKKTRLCFVGSMLGRNAGYVTTQGLITADLFASEGYQVACVSSKLNRIARLAEIIAVLIKDRHRFDLVLLEVYSGLSLIIADAASLICKMFKLPLMMVLHGGNLPEFIEKHPRRTKRVLRRADALVAPSAFLAKKIGVHGFEIHIVPNVLELDLYPFRERSKLFPRFLWMRSFHPIYNPEMAIEVFAELRKSYPNATLTMAGVDKGLEPKIKQMVAEINLSDAVNFPGFLSAGQKARAFSESDIFLNTNRADNMPVAVVEACACGLPVVATNVGGLPFLISHGENGLLVENENVGEMVEAVKLLLEDSDLAQKIARGGRVLAERSAWTTVRADWEKLFAEVLDKKTEDSPSRLRQTA